MNAAHTLSTLAVVALASCAVDVSYILTVALSDFDRALFKLRDIDARRHDASPTAMRVNASWMSSAAPTYPRRAYVRWLDYFCTECGETPEPCKHAKNRGESVRSGA
jgi:hypothetical protein